MSLADGWDDKPKGQYLEEGQHPCIIKGFSFHNYNSGTRGVEFEVGDESGAKSKIDFCLKSSILWRLQNFAKACGMTKEEARKVDPEKEKGFDAFVNKRVGITVEKDEKGYHQGKDFFSLDGEQMSKIAKVASVVKRATKPKAEEPEPVAVAADDVPF